MKMLSISTLCLLLGAGCATSPRLVLDAEGYTVRREFVKYCEPGVLSPSMCIATLADYRAGDGAKESRMYITPASSAGIANALVGAGAAIGSSVFIGKGLEESGSGDTTVDVRSTSGAGAAAIQQ